MNDRKLATLWLGRKDFAVLVAYFVMVCVAVWFYQPWEDEGRAWMIARSFNLYPLVFRILRYEGHPALWYLLLWGPAHLHLPFTCINWISVAFGSAGIYILLRFAPFPFYLRALLPFSFFLAYQYSVVARSYVLFPLLGFLVAHLYRQAPGKPVRMASVLALLANVSIHGTLVALGFAALYAGKLIREWQSNPVAFSRREVFLGAGLFAGSILFVALCLWPTADLVPPLSPTLTRIIHRLALPKPASSISPPGRTSPVSGVSLRISAPLQKVVLDPLTPLAAFVPEADRPASGLTQRMVRLPHALSYAFASFHPLAFLYEALLLAYLYRTGKLTLLLPAALLLTFLVFVSASEWHFGLLWVTLLMTLWAAWDSSVEPRGLRLQNAVAGLLAGLCVLQLPWTFGAIQYEIHHATYPAHAAADYLKTLPPGKRLAGLGDAFTVQPYFLQNVLLEDIRPPSIPAGGSLSHAQFSAVFAVQPDVILADNQNISVGNISLLRAAGYQETHAFCGAPYLPNRPIRPLCLLVLERDQ